MTGDVRLMMMNNGKGVRAEHPYIRTVYKFLVV